MRTVIEIFERSFAELHSRTLALLAQTSDAKLYRRPREIPQTMAMFTVGAYILRSASAVEQTFGGITTRLWDDPFEWTLPEKLATGERVREYLSEVEVTTISGFKFLTSDKDLTKEMPAPADLKPVSQILLETLSRAEHFQGRAYAIFQMISDEKLPRI